jgi:hypothetical protein
MDRGIPSLLLFASIFASSARGQAQDRRTTRFAAGPLTAVVVFEDTGVARLDPQLRNATSRSGEPIPRSFRMYENFDRRTRLYATSDIVVQLRAATEIDYKPFFERHIQGPTPL